MLNNMMGVNRKLRDSINVPAASTVTVPLDPWDRIEGAVGVVAYRATVPAASAGDITTSLMVGEANPVPRALVSVERAVGAGPQIEDPVYMGAGSRGNRIFIRLTNSDAANAAVVTFDVEVRNRYAGRERQIAQ